METPPKVATGQHLAISPDLAFHLYESVASTNKLTFYLQESTEHIGRIFDIIEHKGDCLPFLVLDSLSSQAFI
jgi:hypothetical protein